jgi:hypothetical protein
VGFQSLTEHLAVSPTALLTLSLTTLGCIIILACAAIRMVAYAYQRASEYRRHFEPIPIKTIQKWSWRAILYSIVYCYSPILLSCAFEIMIVRASLASIVFAGLILIVMVVIYPLVLVLFINHPVLRYLPPFPIGKSWLLVLDAALRVADTIAVFASSDGVTQMISLCSVRFVYAFVINRLRPVSSFPGNNSLVHGFGWFFFGMSCMQLLLFSPGTMERGSLTYSLVSYQFLIAGLVAGCVIIGKLLRFDPIIIMF